MKMQIILSLVIVFSLHSADKQDNFETHKEQTQLRKECALVAIDAALLNFEKMGLSAEDRVEFDHLSFVRDLLIEEKWSKIHCEWVERIFYGDEHKAKIRDLYQGICNYTKKKEHSSNSQRNLKIDLIQRIHANNERVIDLHAKLFPEHKSK